jgi:hypothetical protein
VQSTVEGEACTMVHQKCSIYKEGCHSYCQRNTEIQDFDSLLGWKCDYFNICTCLYNYIPSKHPDYPTRRCTIGEGPCNIDTQECNSKCAAKYHDGHGSCINDMGDTMCICTYTTSWIIFMYVQ